ncbi:MAG: hypothetical protein RMM53_10345, partial [Bacteroidia bacterium]|nr:hypothetical protein [Bacteroidia bacterium]MDW8334602.1 hypothetical protein [Bacteroidia bacterium]
MGHALVVVSATEMEILPTVERYRLKRTSFGFGDDELQIWITGVGAVNTALKTAFFAQKYGPGRLWINVGVAGAYDVRTSLAEVWEVTRERYGDVGAETDEGFASARELGFALTEYDDDVLLNPRPYGKLRCGAGLTVQTCSGNEETIRLRRGKFNADLETMEGAAFFQSALWHDVPFYAFRAVSNHVVPRRSQTWKIRQAVE